MKHLRNEVTLALLSAMPQFALAKATCTLNGEEVPCPEIGGWATGVLIIIPILFIIVGIIAFIFWVRMLVHAIRTPIKDKALWIIILLLFTVLGAIVYYFTIKRPMSPFPLAHPQGPTHPPAQ